MIKSMLTFSVGDVSSWINENIGTTWVSIIIVVLAMIGCIMIAGLIKGMAGKTKPLNKWNILKILFVAAIVGVIIWLCTTY